MDKKNTKITRDVFTMQVARATIYARVQEDQYGNFYVDSGELVIGDDGRERFYNAWRPRMLNATSLTQPAVLECDEVSTVAALLSKAMVACANRKNAWKDAHRDELVRRAEEHKVGARTRTSMRPGKTARDKAKHTK
jgi:hypothetical protein